MKVKLIDNYMDSYGSLEEVQKFCNNNEIEIIDIKPICMIGGCHTIETYIAYFIMYYESEE